MNQQNCHDLDATEWQCMLYNVPIENWSMIFKPRQRIHYWVVTHPNVTYSCSWHWEAFILSFSGKHKHYQSKVAEFHNLQLQWQETVMYIWFVHLSTTTQKCEQTYPYPAITSPSLLPVFSTPPAFPLILLFRPLLQDHFHGKNQLSSLYITKL